MNNMHIRNKWGPVLFAFFFTWIFPIQLFAQSVSHKIDSVKRLVTDSKTDTSKISSLIILSKLFSCSDKITKIDYCRQALQLSQNIQWETGIIEANMELGSTYEYCVKDHAISIKYFQEALSTSKKITTNSMKH